MKKMKKMLKDFREKSPRDNEIIIESIKSYIGPNLFVGYFMIVIILLFVIVTMYFKDIKETLYVPILLGAQCVIIFWQLIIIYFQTKYLKFGHVPEFIIEIKDVTGGPTWKAIHLKNIGGTAHRVTWKVKTKRKDKLKIGENYPQLYTMANNEKKLAFEINKDDFKNKKIVLIIYYRTKTGSMDSIKFIKTSYDPDFIPIEYL
jgi:hypothetical protein